MYLAAIDHVPGQDDGWKRFRTLVKGLATAFALAVPRPETDLIAPHRAFFQRAAAMIARLIDLARDLREAQRQGDALGLSTEEIAFYDALAENASAREVMQSDALRLMARELTEMVRRMPRLDWTQRESVRATLRRNVRRLLAKYGYPPDLADGATQLVLRQAELSTEDCVE